MTTNLCILPTPRSITPRRGAFRCPKRLQVRASPEAEGLAAIIAEALEPLGKRGASFEFKTDIPKAANMRLFIAAPSKRLPAARTIRAPRCRDEAYRLTVSANAILVEAKTPHGLFNGLMTLRQFLGNHSPAPCVAIEDAPDMAVRSVHMDVKGCTPTVDYMKKLIVDLSHYKINDLLMEYENAVALDSTPGVAKPSAWSKDDVRVLADLARSRFIDLTPLVQSLGHVEYILQHDAYAHLRESQTNAQQYCPSKPETFEFWKHQADEILELTDDSPYFHVGADETALLGHCRRCKGRIRRGETDLDIYLEHMNKVWRHVLDLGKTPVFWDDMIARNYTPARIRKIPKGVAVMYWIYNITGDTTSTLPLHSGRYGRRELLEHDRLNGLRRGERNIGRWLDEMSSDEWRRYRPYVDDDTVAPEFPSMPFIEMFAERGVEVFGASAAKCGADSFSMPDLAARVDNIAAWARAIADAGQTGVCSTAWSRNASLMHPYAPFDAMWYPMCASAQFYWSARGASVDEFQRLFDRDFFGLDDDGWSAQVLEATSTGMGGAPIRELAKLEVTRNANVLDAYRLCHRVHSAITGLFGALQRHSLSHYQNGLPFQGNRNPVIGQLRRHLKNMPRLKKEALAYYRSVMLREEADELAESQFRFFEDNDFGL